MSLSFCPAVAQAAAPGASPLINLLPFAVIGVMIFFLFRSQSKEKRRQQEMINSIKAGDRIVTSGGILGAVAAVKEKTLMVKIAEKVTVEISKSAVGGIIGADADPKELK
jgi:preprotein translocase subunit YajC